MALDSVAREQFKVVMSINVDYKGNRPNVKIFVGDKTSTHCSLRSRVVVIALTDLCSVLVILSIWCDNTKACSGVADFTAQSCSLNGDRQQSRHSTLETRIPVSVYAHRCQCFVSKFVIATRLMR